MLFQITRGKKRLFTVVTLVSSLSSVAGSYMVLYVAARAKGHAAMLAFAIVGMFPFEMKI